MTILIINSDMYINGFMLGLLLNSTYILLILCHGHHYLYSNIMLISDMYY